MDFDDLEDCEAADGGNYEDRHKELIEGAMPEEKTFPLPPGRKFGTDKKMKMLYLHGGGTNEKIAKMQIMNVFKEVPDQKLIMEWTVWTGPHKVPLGWNGDFSLKPFGPDFTVYFERWPFANCQWENWDGIDTSIKEFKAFLKENGPFDGAMGFDMGGEFLVQIARLAQEGDPDLQQPFRFLILFTTCMAKHMSEFGKAGGRPKNQLRIPAICSWCDGDQNHTYMWYEETVNFFHKDFREVIYHQDGHMPPRLQKESSELQRLTRFLDYMRKPVDAFVPSDHPDNKLYERVFLPMIRVEAPLVPEGATRRLLVVSDPLGLHDFEKRLVQLEDMISKGLVPNGGGEKFVVGGAPVDPAGSMRLKLQLGKLTFEDFQNVTGSSLKVEGVTYTKEQLKYNWHCSPEKVPSPQLNPEDIIDDEKHVSIAKNWADQFMNTFSLDSEEHLSIVGLGTGAYIAMAIAKMLVQNRRRVPYALWVVNPPTRLPWSATEEPGVLLDCPIHMLVHENATYGPGWRYEVSTCGPFSTGIYKDMDNLIKLIVEGSGGTVS